MSSHPGPFFTIEVYKKTYENAIFPPILANITGEVIHSPLTSFSLHEEVAESEIQSDDNPSILPHSTRYPSGRLHKLRIHTDAEQSNY